MAKLTDTQLLLLTTAVARADGSLLPPPDQLGDLAARVRRAIASLLKRALVEEVDAAESDQVWREEDGRRLKVVITDAGRAIAGPPPAVLPALAVAAEPVAGTTKIASVLGLLRREGGATLAELVAATGWLPHTTRAALTGLRKKGHGVERSKRGDETCYSLAEQA